jgi:hypothetical protein
MGIMTAPFYNAHMAEVMWLHYDERIHHHATPEAIKPLLQKNQQYWEQMYLRETSRSMPLKKLIERVS